jgi:hypothetical protein
MKKPEASIRTPKGDGNIVDVFGGDELNYRIVKVKLLSGGEWTGSVRLCENLAYDYYKELEKAAEKERQIYKALYEQDALVRAAYEKYVRENDRTAEGE